MHRLARRRRAASHGGYYPSDSTRSRAELSSLGRGSGPWPATSPSRRPSSTPASATVTGPGSPCGRAVPPSESRHRDRRRTRTRRDTRRPAAPGNGSGAPPSPRPAAVAARERCPAGPARVNTALRRGTRRRRSARPPPRAGPGATRAAARAGGGRGPANLVPHVADDYGRHSGHPGDGSPD